MSSNKWLVRFLSGIIRKCIWEATCLTGIQLKISKAFNYLLYFRIKPTLSPYLEASELKLIFK